MLVLSRTKKTLLNALIGMVHLVVTSVLSLFVNRLILSRLGSDYNGVNATVTQSIAVLGLLEGGFTMASLVALYVPYTQNNYSGINAILSTTRKAFNRVGAYTLILGVVISLAYPLFIKTGLPYPTLLLIFLLSVIPLSFNFSYILKYRLIFQVAQQEYAIVTIQLVSTIVAQLLSLLVLSYYPNVIILRLINAVMILASGYAIKRAAVRTFGFLNLHQPADFSIIRGTKDVFVGNITGYIYSSTTVLFISTFISTVITSVYAVYNSIITIMLNIVYVILRSPQSALGQIIAEQNRERTRSVFEMFEYITILSVCFVFSITYSFIVPFVSIYAASAKDGNYINEFFAVSLILISAFELVHIPSGICINLHGDFRAVRNIQLSSCVLIIVASFIGAYTWGTYGIIGARLLTAVYLAIVEICYVRRRTLSISFSSLLKMLIPNIILAISIAIIIKHIVSPKIGNFRQFFFYGGTVSLTVLVLFIAVNWLILPEQMNDIFSRARAIIRRFGKNTAIKL